MPCDASGAFEKAARIHDLIAARVAETMPAVAIACAADAASRAPTVDEEYNALMGEDGGGALVPRAGDRSADKDDRVRMIKPESTYLENAILAPDDLFSDENTAAVGNPLHLEASSTYKYINIRRTGKHEHEQSEEHEVGPYFNAVEAGGSATVIPVFTLLNGHKYPLQPSDDPKAPAVWSMVKSFIPHNMFAPFNLLARAREIITTALAEMNGG